MARKSRERDDYGVYHVRQQSSGITELFSDDGEREAFLEIIRQSAEKNNFRLLSYCVADPDIYHLILDSNGCDISRIMKEINIRYSIFKDCRGELFKDRFQSRLLTSGYEREGSGDEAVRIGPPRQYSSCQDFRESIRALTPAGEFADLTTSLDQSVFQRGCRERISTREEAEERLKERAEALDRSLDELIRDKPLRNELILEMKACSTLSMKEIGQIFGLSESSVSKLLKPKTAGLR